MTVKELLDQAKQLNRDVRELVNTRTAPLDEYDMALMKARMSAYLHKLADDLEAEGQHTFFGRKENQDV